MAVIANKFTRTAETDPAIVTDYSGCHQALTPNTVRRSGFCAFRSLYFALRTLAALGLVRATNCALLGPRHAEL